MRIFNENKTIEYNFEDLNFEIGYLIDDTIEKIIPEISAIREEGHYEVVKEYPETGGKDYEWVVDRPGRDYQPEKTETENIQIYKTYTEEELKEKHKEKQEKERQDTLETLKKQLSDTDYQAIKYAEGWYTEEEYASIKEYREGLRIQIRKLMEEEV